MDGSLRIEGDLQKRAEELAKEFAEQARTIHDVSGLMRLMMKSALEQMLNTEMDVHLGRRASTAPADGVATDETSQAESSTTETEPSQKSSNRRNGKSKKTVRSDTGDLTIATPRDREGTFEPQIVEKHQRHIPDFDEKILALYAKGMTTRDIQDIVRELYGVDVSATLVSEVTSDLDAEVTAWRTRPIDPVWPIIYFDGWWFTFAEPTAMCRNTRFMWQLA